eukprot:Nitzschia sp. Nitz4//scaffold238_size30058//17373//18602//NITZ4_008002-RA/size30058-processed-gene-0.55-mRNA-1//1//CDS//3329543537//5663//frame0
MSGLQNDTTHAHAVYHHHEEGDQNTSSLSSGVNDDDDPDEAMDEEEINNTHNHHNRTLMVSRAVRAAAAADAVSLGDSSSFDSAQAKENATLENSIAMDFAATEGSLRHVGKSIDASHAPVSPLGASAYIVPFKLAAPQCPDDSDSSDADQHRNQVPSSPIVSAEFQNKLPLHRMSSPHLARPPLVDLPAGPPRLLSLDQAGVIEGHSTPLAVQGLVVTNTETNTTEFIPLNDSKQVQPRVSIASSTGNHSPKRESGISHNTTSTTSFQIMKSMRRSHNWGDLEFRHSAIHSDTTGKQASEELKEDTMVYDSAPRPPRRSILGGPPQGTAEPSKILQRMKEGISAGSNFFLSDYHASTLPRSQRHHTKPEDVLMEEKLKRSVIWIGVFICFLLVVLSVTVLVFMVSNAK